MSEKKVLVLGANGMLGKMISLHLNSLKFSKLQFHLDPKIRL